MSAQPRRSITVTTRRSRGFTMTISSRTIMNLHSGMPVMIDRTVGGQSCNVTVCGTTEPDRTSKFTFVTGETFTLRNSFTTRVRCSLVMLTFDELDEVLLDPLVLVSPLPAVPPDLPVPALEEPVPPRC